MLRAPSAGPSHPRSSEEMLARLGLASGRRISKKISSSPRLYLDVICFSREKIFKVDVAVTGHGFHTFSVGNLGRRNNATTIPGYTMRDREVAVLRQPNFEPHLMTHPSQVGSTSPWTLFAAMLLETRCRAVARRRAPRTWSQLTCALAWTVLATCSLRTSSLLRRRSTRRATRTCCARTTIRGRRRSAVLTLSSHKTDLHLTQLVPLVLCLVRCPVKLWRGPLSRPICP